MTALAEMLGSETLAWVLVVLVALVVLIGIAVFMNVSRWRKEDAPQRRGLELQLARTRESLVDRLQNLFGGDTAEFLEQLEEILVTSDFGIETTEELLKRVQKKGVSTPEEIRQALREAMLEVLTEVEHPTRFDHEPTVIMVVGVNGVGKTTSIGKVAAQLTSEGKRVVLGAGDTFRAAAIEQLTIWAERSGAEIIKGQPDGDPAAVSFDAVSAGKARGAAAVICDTAGRLHTKVNLMDELKKVKRVMGKAMEGAPHEIWLVVDATTGQNAMRQAHLFHDAVGLTGIIMTKLDGTAKGGTLVGLVRELHLPIRFIGVGEGVLDLRPFDPQAYVKAILGE